jgi:aminoglycoside 3-N-acetyltransferase
MNPIRTELATRLKRRIKPIYFNGQRAVARTLFAYAPAALEAAIRSLGIGAGDAVLVHSGFRRSSGFIGQPGDVVDVLLRIVGADGHILMMSIPYRGSSQHYAESDPLFDVQRTPSAVGVISEVFRRRTNVARSLNPLHPVVACGPLAAWLTADHDKTLYSCGKGSPFERFLHLNGKFLFFDAPYGSLTFMHYVEDLFRSRLAFELYHPEPVTLRVRDAAGYELAVRQCFFSAEARARRNFTTVERKLRQDGHFQSARVGNSRLLTVGARSVVDCASRLMEQGQGFYM